MKRLGKELGILLLVLLCQSSAGVRALTDEEIFRDFRFNFINPGARSLGLGGAFIAAADDATAAQANPAALHYVFRSEVFAEYRTVEREPAVFVPRTTTPGDVVNFEGTEFPRVSLQTVTGLDDTPSFSFLSYAVPFRLGARRASVAVSRQVVLDVESSLADDQAGGTQLQFTSDQFDAWLNSGAAEACGTEGALEQYSVCNLAVGSLDTEIVHNNVSFSYSFHDDFSVGLTLTYATIDMRSQVINTTQDPEGFLERSNPRVTPVGGLPPIETRTAVDDEDSDVTYTIGLHWHPDEAFPTGYSPLRFGLVYRKGARFTLDESFDEFNPATNQFESVLSTPTFENIVRVPDRYGLGISYQIGQQWTFAVDVERIEYSDLLEGYRTGVNLFTSGTISTAFPDLDLSELQFDVDDATVFHGGVEFLSKGWAGWTYALRAGYFNAPDNRIRLRKVENAGGDPATNAEIEEAFRDAFRGGEDEDHFTAGFSVNTPTGIQLQFAGDFSDPEDQYLASAIYRFGKSR